MSIFILVVSLAILILVHEFGHFIVAKKTGVRVDEFGIGFPPKLFGKKFGETAYTVNLLPFGGFVKIFGENPDEEALHGPDKARSFIRKPKRVQAAIIAAGVFFNFLLAWVLISAGFMSGMPVPVSAAPEGALVKDARIMITNVEKDSPAEKAGLKAGDTLIALYAGYADGSSLELKDLSIRGIQDFIAGQEGNDIVINYANKYTKDFTEFVRVTPQTGIFGETPAIGIAMDEIGIVKLLPHRAVWEGLLMTGSISWSVAAAFGGLIRDAFTGNVALENLTGPIGIVGLIGDAAGFGFAYLLSFVAFISINLAVLNLLPIPALDGGRLFFLLVEAVKGSRLPPKFVNTAHLVGFAVLILFMLAVTYQDIMRIISG